MASGDQKLYGYCIGDAGGYHRESNGNWLGMGHAHERGGEVV